MIFYTIIMSIINLSVSLMVIGQDLKRTKSPLQVTVSLLERI